MKFILLFIAFAYISSGPTSTPVDKPMEVESEINTTVYEIFPVDITEVVKEKYGDLDAEEMDKAIEKLLVNDYLSVSKTLGEMDDPCLDGCQVYGIQCKCTVIYFQWCPCPWYHPGGPWAAGREYCQATCANQ